VSTRAAEPAAPARKQNGAPDSRTEAILRAFHEEGGLGKAYDTRLLLRLWPFVRPCRRLLWLSLGLGVVIALLSLLGPLIMKYTIDDGVMKGDSRALLVGGLVFAGVIIFEQGLNFAQVYAAQIVGARSMADLRSHVFGFLHQLRLSYFDRQPVGRLVTRVTNDIDAILELFASGLLTAIVDLVRLVGIVIVMVSIDWQLSLIGFAAAPVVAGLVALVRRRARDAFREIRAKTARMNATMNEQISGMSVVQAFSQQAGAEAEFDAINLSYRNANLRSIKYEALQDAAIEMVAAVCLASIVVALGYHPVTFGTLVAFNAYLLRFFEPISALAQRYTLLQSAMTGAERVFGLLDLQEHDAPRIEPQAAGTASRADASALAFDQVSFAYKPNVPVLRDVTFNARPGEKIALVGPTGSGKTTIVQLLLRLYDVESGEIRVGGEDVRTLDRSDLRGRFAVVPQDVFLFPGTVLSNIAIGDLSPDPRRAEEALRRIGAYDLFARRPGGLMAEVKERGDNFSAGERQLIAFARALYRDAPNLILDEATASVDSDTEARLQHALEELIKGRTAIIIAHRLSTVRAVDRILVLQRGRLVEQGTHDELLRAGGLYARLHDLHFLRQEPSSISPPPG
jgi:ATP-binding cassette, subfamily B, multidrug efflux pump